MIGRPIGLILCLLIIVMLILADKWGIRLGIKVMAWLNVILEILAITIAHIYIQIPAIKNVLSNIVINGMSKMYTMEIRFKMWKGAFEIFMRNILFGIGQPTKQNWFIESNTNIYHTIMHNLPIDIAYTGGGYSIMRIFSLECFNC